MEIALAFILGWLGATVVGLLVLKHTGLMLAPKPSNPVPAGPSFADIQRAVQQAEWDEPVVVDSEKQLQDALDLVRAVTNPRVDGAVYDPNRKDPLAETLNDLT